MSETHQLAQSISNPSPHVPISDKELHREALGEVGRVEADDIWASRLPLIDFVDHNNDLMLPSLFYDSW